MSESSATILAGQEPDRPEAPIDAAIDAALAWADENQHREGFWAGMLESNACIEAEWLLAFHILGYDYPHGEAVVRGILARQRSDGSWESYFNAPSGDINATVESYAALRASSLGSDHEALAKARRWIFDHGGLRQVRVFTRIWLALIGEWPWAHTPNLPPEVIYLPLWTPFNIYHFASWARATLVPLAVLSARRHVRPLEASQRLDELFPDGREEFDYRLVRRGGRWSWNGFFLAADRVLHGLQNLRLTPGRRCAVRRCLDWIVRHQDADGAWGGIQPPWIYSLMALHAEGRALTDPVMARGLATLDGHWSYQRDDCRYIQASESPVWDTLLMLQGMLDCSRAGVDRPVVRKAVGWLLDNEVRQRGDWAVKTPDVESGGWAFERANAAYPDIDDTAVAVLVLSRMRSEQGNADRANAEHGDTQRIDAAVTRAVNWMTAMQSRNGGWGAFDKDNDSEIVAAIPFSDFGEALDPPSADVTAHVLEALGTIGRDRNDPVVARGLGFLRGEQEPAGSWFGRWGVNHIYGTAAVLPALRAIGEDLSADYVRRAANWIVEHQNADGGWGESCASYMDPTQIGRGVSTASQTAWALIGLLAVSDTEYSDAVRRGVGYLCRHQADGTWAEKEYTGTGFPGYGVGARADLADPALSHRLQQGSELQRGFLINYNLYRHYFPLSALGRYRRTVRGRKRSG